MEPQTQEADQPDQVSGSEATLELGRGTGPLRGLKVVELAGIGPAPHACMTLADLGADIIRIDRPGGNPMSLGKLDLVYRGRPSVALDLKRPEAVEVVRRLVADADVLVEGLRPGVTERMGLGPDDLLAVNPRLVYARMTGWGQSGPLAHAAGHDLNYLAISGVLDGLGQEPARPHFPNNILGDFGGGSSYLVIGILAAIFEARGSGQGQVVDAAIVDGVTHLNAMGLSLQAAGLATTGRGTGMLDGGVPFYDVFETSDGRHMAVGPLEPQFYEVFVEVLGIADRAPDRNDITNHAALRELLTAEFNSRTQAEWTDLFEGSDACVAPVLTTQEAAQHEHLRARGTYVERDGLMQPAPAPRFSRTQESLTTPPDDRAGLHTREALIAWGIGDADDLLATGAAVQA